MNLFLFLISKKITVTKDGKNLRLGKAILKDNTDKLSGVFFESTIDEITEGACYKFK